MLNRGNSSCQYGKEKIRSPWRHPQGLATAGGQSHSGKLLRPAISSHSTVFMTTVNILPITAFVAQIFTSFTNESGLFFLPGLSRVIERLQEIAPGLWLQPPHFFQCSHRTSLLPHLHKTAEIMQNSCLPCDKLF